MSRRTGGDDEWFRGLIEPHTADIWRFVRRRVTDAADADDLTAEVLATAWRRRADIPRAGAERLWLFGVARNTLGNHRRSRERRARLQERLDAQPHHRGADGEADDSVWRALAALDDDDRDLLILRAWDGLAVADIAGLLGITPNATSQRLARAKTRLAEALLDVDTSSSRRTRGG